MKDKNHQYQTKLAATRRPQTGPRRPPPPPAQVSRHFGGHPTPNVFYHVTSPVAADDIMKSGLHAGEDGHIYLIAAPDLGCLIDVALGQGFLWDFVLIEVCARGIGVQVEPDNVGGAFARYQVRVRQPVIEARHLSKVCEIKANPHFNPAATLWVGSNALWRVAVANAVEEAVAEGLPVPPELYTPNTTPTPQ